MQKSNEPATEPLEKGDYVLATKWSDGDPQDHWCVGFFDGMLKCDDLDTDRYLVVDANYEPLRANGFRRAERISQERGEWLLQNASMIELSGKSLWEWKDAAATDPRVGATYERRIMMLTGDSARGSAVKIAAEADARIATLEAQLAEAKANWASAERDYKKLRAFYDWPRLDDKGQ